MFYMFTDFNSSFICKSFIKHGTGWRLLNHYMDVLCLSLLGLHPQRKQDLEDSLQAHQYFADANEAESWMKEKEPIVCNTDYGKDEDSSEALLKKHEALVSDLEAFGNTISALREQAQSCRVSIFYCEC